jgi:hypothetical protein
MSYVFFFENRAAYVIIKKHNAARQAIVDRT